jgi:AcrR family transcriptional regulator
LEAAVACFEERGYDDTTTAQIARRAGVGVGTLYGYFLDKRTILLELVRETLSEIAEYVVKSLDPRAWVDGDPRASVRRLIDALFHTRTFNPGMQRIIWERYFKDAEFRSVVQEIEHRIRSATVSLFRSLKKRRMLRVDDVSTAAFVTYAAVEWTTARLMLGESGAEVDATVEAASDMISRYLFEEPMSGRPRRIS